MNPVEPSYDSIKTQDASLCWQTFPPQADSSIAATGTSGRCETACFVSAYKYTETTGPTTNPITTFHWHLDRGCAKNEAEMKSGTTPSKDLFGVSITNYACDYRNRGHVKSNTCLKTSIRMFVNVRALMSWNVSNRKCSTIQKFYETQRTFEYVDCSIFVGP